MITVRQVNIPIPASLIAGLSQAALTQVAKDVADGARAHWSNQAKRELRTTREDYLRGLQRTAVTGNGTATVALLGWLPNAIENGLPEMDLRDVLLGPKIPVAPHGAKGKRETDAGGEYYRAIPFRHQTPGTKGSMAPVMGSAYEQTEVNAKALGREVYKAARKLEATRSDPYTGKVSYGGRLEELAGLLKPHHKTDVYAGMIREVKTYEKDTQPTYMTFRMIATHKTVSLPGRGLRNRRVRVRNEIGWHRPATPGVKLAEASAKYAESIAVGAVKSYLEAIA